MFSQTLKRSDNQPEQQSSHNDQSPYSPQTRPFHLPINSYKSLISGSPNTFNQQPTRLNLLIQPQSQTGLNSKTITLVSSNEGSLHFHDQAASVFQRYSNNDVNFVGVWGSQNCDKGYFLDRILNLSDVEGDKYTEVGFQIESNSQLFFYERPFVKDKMRFFLVNSKGYKNPSNLTKTQKSQLDIMLSICQDSTSVDIIEVGLKHLDDAFSRLYVDPKKRQEQLSQICWPNSLFVVYTAPDSIKKHRIPQNQEQELCRMFKDYSFGILHSKNACSQKQVKTYTTITNALDQLYSKNAYKIFLEIYSKMERKDFLNVRYNGLTCPHILAEIVYKLNQHDCLYLPRAFSKAKRSIFSSLYNRHALSYLLKMKQFISEQKPYSTDYLLSAFQDASEQTLDQYYETQNEISVRPAQDSLCIQYQKKLEDYIEQKQRNILAVNNKKSAKQLHHLQANNPNEQLKKVHKSILGPTKRSYDHNADSAFIANQIKSLYLMNVLTPQIKSKEIPIQQIEDGQEELFDRQINQKKIQLSKKKAELEHLSTVHLKNVDEASKVMREVDKLKQQQRQLELNIKKVEENLAQLRLKNEPNLESNFGSGGSDQFLIHQAKSEIDELKKVLETKINQKNKLKEGNIVLEPEAQLLQSKLAVKRSEVDQVKKSGLPNAGQNSVSGAEKRNITPREANIRRVHNSKI